MKNFIPLIFTILLGFTMFISSNKPVKIMTPTILQIQSDIKDRMQLINNANQ